MKKYRVVNGCVISDKMFNESYNNGNNSERPNDIHK